MTNRSIYNLMGTNYAAFKKFRYVVKKYSEQPRTPTRREVDELIADVLEHYKTCVNAFNDALEALVDIKTER